MLDSSAAMSSNEDTYMQSPPSASGHASSQPGQLRALVIGFFWSADRPIQLQILLVGHKDTVEGQKSYIYRRANR